MVFNSTFNKVICLTGLIMLIACTVSCDEANSHKELDDNELKTLRDLLARYLTSESDESAELDDIRTEKKSILLPRIGSEKRSPSILFPRIGYEKKRGYHMPRIGRSYQDTFSQEQEYEKRAIHMPRIGK